MVAEMMKKVFETELSWKMKVENEENTDLTEESMLNYLALGLPVKVSSSSKHSRTICLREKSTNTTSQAAFIWQLNLGVSHKK